MRKISIAILCLSVVLGACKKTIDEIRPSDTIDQEKAFQTIADLVAGATGAYGGISGEGILYVGAIMSDESKISSENRGQGQFLHKWTHTSGDADAGRAWQNMFVIIDRANRVLAAIDKIPAIDANEQATKDRVRGEMMALRAWAHFELWRWYSPKYDANAPGVPYMVESKISSPARESTGSNFSSIKSDLNQAKTLIPASFTDVTRITRIGVSAIQARLALYEGDWANAITYATEVITAVPLATRANYPGIWTDGNNNEVVWKLSRNSNQAVNTLWRDTNGDVFFLPSDKLKNSFNRTTDVRFASTILVNPANTDPDDTVLVNKYPGRTGALQTNDIKLFRVAEMYLIRAEARAETNDLVGGAADLNALRAARINGYVAQVFATKQALIDAVMDERFKELAFEGHRYFDLKRRGLPINRSTSDSAPEFRNLDPTNFLYLLPIPQREIFANPNMEQNPGY